MSDHRKHDLCLRPKDPYDWRWRFLQHVAAGDSMAVAAAKCNKSRQTVYNQLKRHDNFRRKYHHAKMSFIDKVETNLNSIANSSSHLYNFPAMMAILKAYKPGLYNPKPKVEADGLGPEQVAMVLHKVLKDPEQFEAALADIKALVDEQRKKER